MSPKILKQNLFIALLLCAFSSIQATTYEYWFAAPDLSSEQGDSPIEVIITTTSKAANVELSIPANPSFTPITRNLSAWDHESISLSAYLSLIEPTAGAVESKGILIESSSPINVQYAVYTQTTWFTTPSKARQLLEKSLYFQVKPNGQETIHCLPHPRTQWILLGF